MSSKPASSTYVTSAASGASAAPIEASARCTSSDPLVKPGAALLKRR
jgi:hypothetical protein